MVFILVDMDREDQILYKGTKYSIIGPLLKEIYGGALVRYDTKTAWLDKGYIINRGPDYQQKNVKVQTYLVKFDPWK